MNAFSLLRALMIYGICLPLAIFIGYLLATPTDLISITTVAFLLALMTIPLLMRWHYQLLVLSWNASAGLYFLPGKPSLVLALSIISFFISAVGFIMNRNLKFISAPSVTKALIFIVIVVMGTAEMTGGFGLNALGGSNIGGKRYLFLLSSICGYFALTAYRIPPEKAKLYVNMFFLGGLTAAIGNLFYVINPSFDFIFLIFPADMNGLTTNASEFQSITRFSGLALASLGVIYALLARYGIEGLFDLRKFWRLPTFLLFSIISLLGGFRSMAIGLMILYFVLFYLEDLFRSKLLPVLLLFFILAGTITIPFANKLPLAIQRSLTFLPLDLNPEAEISSSASTDWRLEMWANVLPMVPQYLILGKGLSISSRDFDMVTHGMNRGELGSEGAEMAGDYHNGPLSVIIPFGIPGVVAFLWFIVVASRALYFNYKYGDPALLHINRFLLAYFIMRTLLFVFIVGAFFSEMLFFLGIMGLSFSLNGGISSPVKEPVTRPVFNRLRMAQSAR